MAVATTKPVATPTAQPAKPVLSMREVQPKKAAPSSLQSLGQDFDMLAHKPGPGVTLEDVLKPVYWANVANLVAKDALNTRRDKLGSLIYVRPESGAFKVILTIEGISLDQFGQANGLKVEPWLLDNQE
jgi:hypothetical protein